VERDLVKPGLDGVINFLEAAKFHGLKRVVLTSSMAAVTEHPVTGHTFTEADWNTKSTTERNPYYYSKTVAERKAWEFAKEHGLDLITINPFVILGRALSMTSADNPSAEIIYRIIMGEFPGYFDFHWGFVDVIDVATAHVNALTSLKANGRYLCIGSAIYMKRVCHVLSAAFPQYPVPSAEMDGAGGTALLKLGSFFETRDVGTYMRSNIAQTLSFDTSKIQQDLGLEFRSVDDTILDTVKSLIRYGKIPEMRKSRLTTSDVTQISNELILYKPEGIIKGDDLLSWLIKRQKYSRAPTRAVRDAERLQEAGVLVGKNNFSSILPIDVKEALSVDVLKVAASLPSFTIITLEKVTASIGDSTDLGIPDGGEDLPAEYEFVLKQGATELLTVANAGVSEGWSTLKVQDGVKIEKCGRGKVSCFKGTTVIKANPDLIANSVFLPKVKNSEFS
jgi:dihydroflavonol-4-reductase